MDAGTVSGIVTAILLVAFLCIVAWAYSKRRKKDFEAAARQPLQNDGGRK
jgi:cytochrome c oxidase cbb3-type subunit IV